MEVGREIRRGARVREKGRRREEMGRCERRREREKTGIEIGGKVRESSGGGAEKKVRWGAEVKEGESAGHMGKQAHSKHKHKHGDR